MKLTYLIGAIAGLFVLALAVHLLRPEPSGEPFIARATGTSMEPTMSGDTYAYVRRIPWGELEAGMIALMDHPRRADELVMHRLVERNFWGWVTQGDNNDRPDRFTMTRRDYHGVVLYWDNEDGSITTTGYGGRFLDVAD